MKSTHFLTLCLVATLAAACDPIDRELLPPTQQGTAPLAMSNIRCTPSYGTGAVATVVAGQDVQCVFDIQNPNGEEVNFSCENEDGSPVDCTADNFTTFMGLYNFNTFPPTSAPITRGQFYLLSSRTEGKAGSSIVVYWVTSNAQHKTRQRFEVNVVPDDGVAQPPLVTFDCGGDTDGDVSVTAGDTLSCIFVLGDPDPYRHFQGSYSWQGAAPVNSVTPDFTGVGGQRILPFTWKSELSEKGAAFHYVHNLRLWNTTQDTPFTLTLRAQ